MFLDAWICKPTIDKMLTLAYKYVALAVMLAEVNFCSRNLNLSQQLPVTEKDIVAEIIHDPMKLTGFGGRIDTDDYSFCFVGSSRLRFITKLDAPSRQSYGVYRGQESVAELMDRMMGMKPIINTNDAYRLATNWLISIGVDLQKLESERPALVLQQFLESPGAGKIPIPLFYVRWGSKSKPTVDIMISGVSGQLLNLRQEDDSYSKRPISLIKDMDKLLAISDEDFLKMSLLEKNNLVARFAAVQYPPLENPVQTRTNAAIPHKQTPP